MGCQTMHFHIAKAGLFLKIIYFRIYMVATNNLVLMRNCVGDARSVK